MTITIIDALTTNDNLTIGHTDCCSCSDNQVILSWHLQVVLAVSGCPDTDSFRLF